MIYFIYIINTITFHKHSSLHGFRIFTIACARGYSMEAGGHCRVHRRRAKVNLEQERACHANKTVTTLMTDITP